MSEERTVETKREFLVMAHRGASADAPANTWPAFELAMDLGANVIETDVHWTRDGILVVAHDDTVDDVSDGHGKIRDMTYKELKSLDFGYQFTKDGKSYPFRGKGVGIITFEELLQRWPNMRLNVDLKPKQARVASFIKLLDQANAMDRVVLASFNHRTLCEARSRCKQIQTSASTREVIEFLLHFPEIRQILRMSNVPYVALQIPRRSGPLHFARPRFVRRAHRLGIEVHVWTVNEASDMRQLINVGVNGIVTDKPDLLRKLLENRA